MSTLVFTRRYLSDYARNPVNLLLLAIVPIVFVVVVASSLADSAKLLGGTGGIAVETATAGWAAAFLAGIGMYFQTAATRDTDRRLVIAGLPASQLTLARLLTGLTLAGIASATALVALGARTGIQYPARAIAGTLMFAVIYVAIGAVVGTLSRNPVNGIVIVLFVWILDVFFGPAMGSADRLATRFLPTHFVTLWMVDLPSGHGGRLGDLGWALTWTVIAAAAAWSIAAARTRTNHPSRWSHRASTSQVAAAMRAAWRDGRRNPAQWVLFVVVPLVFILTANAVTPNTPITVFLDDHDRRLAKTLPMPDLHGATMAPIAIASLAALIGLFVLLDSRTADSRVALAGLRPRALFTARLAVLAITVVAAAAVSMLTTALVFDASRWPTYIAANLLIGLTYALIGALLAPIFGRVGGVFLAFLLPFIDLGVVQSPMLHPTPTTASMFLPGYGGSRVLLDGALTRGFDETTPLLIGLSWLLGLLIAVYAVYRRAISPTRHFGYLNMIPHHAQAVEMADMALATAVDPEVKALAQTIKGAQDPEIKTMTGWLTDWKAPVPGTGLSHSMSGGGMGMMSDTDMAAQGKATGAEFDKMWVDMMTHHHTGAIAMANTEIKDGQYAAATATPSGFSPRKPPKSQR